MSNADSDSKLFSDLVNTPIIGDNFFNDSGDRFSVISDKCGYCQGTGWKTDDSYSRFKCPWCGGTGIDESNVKVEKEYVYGDCSSCGEPHRVANMLNGLCSKCQWECPKCETITVKPEGDYICDHCRYGDK